MRGEEERGIHRVTIDNTMDKMKVSATLPSDILTAETVTVVLGLSSSCRSVWLRAQL